MSMQTALLLIDAQNDYLNHPALTPPVDALLANISRLLANCRLAGIPVFHVHTLVEPDGSNRMPHWKKKNYWACVEGTAGAQPPDSVKPQPGEKTFSKTHYSAFENPALTEALTDRQISRLIVAGVHTHACVRSTVLDAYQMGFDVILPEDTVASYDALAALSSLQFLNGRACLIVSLDSILGELEINTSRQEVARLLPVGRIGREWLAGTGHSVWHRHNPAKWEECMYCVPIADQPVVDKAIASAKSGQVAWRAWREEDRCAVILRWADCLRKKKSDLLDLLSREIGKPGRDGEAEFEWALSLIHATAMRIAGEKEEVLTGKAKVRYLPVGTIGLITPWNNPLAIPVGKLAPALAYGNTVVWKPALPATRASHVLMETLDEAGIPSACVAMLSGDAYTGMLLASHPGIDAISFTGSSLNGKHLASACAISGKPLQAELGGNNAVIIMDCDDPDKVAKDLSQAMFSFAGQRCTAPRRLLVARHLKVHLQNLLVEAIQSLYLGEAADPETDIGPMISRNAQQKMHALVTEAKKTGAKVLCGGQMPAHLQDGCWYMPTLIENPSWDSRVVLEDVFGPVAVWQDVNNLDEALQRCNAVEQGLVATLMSNDRSCQQQFLDRAEAGILRINQFSGLHPDAPFSGWKASGIGPPEHGVSDRMFYTRVQTVYEADSV